MDFPPIFWIFWAFTLVIIIAGIRRKWRRRKAWKDAADELGIAYVGALNLENLKLEGDIDGVNVFVHLERSDRNIKGPQIFTVVEATHAQSSMLQEHIVGVVEDQQKLVDTIREKVEQARRESQRS